MPEWRADIRARLAGLGLSPVREAEIVEELTQHLDDRYHEARGRGASDPTARSEALAELAGDALLGELLGPIERRPPPPAAPPGGSTGPGWFAGLTGDLRYAVRALRRSPGFTVVAVVSLALGNGANSAVFRLLEAI